MNEFGHGTMGTKLNYLWRMMVTGGCFALFGLGGMVMSAVVFPSMRLLPGGQERRSARAKWLINRLFALLVLMLQRLGIMRLEITGGDRLTQCRGMLVLANHPTYIDVVVLLSRMPGANCVVKSALWRSPFFGGVVRAADYISNAAAETLIDDCVESLLKDKPLVIFPEGTRTRPGKSLKFLRGAAYISLRSNKPVLPVLLYCDPPTLTKGEKWYRIPPRAFCFRMKVLPPIAACSFVDTSEPPAIAARKLTDALENYFAQELDTHGRVAA